MSISISIADDHPIVLAGLEKLLKDHPRIELLDLCPSGTVLLDKLKDRQPDVLLLDIQMPDKQGNELARIISQEYPQIVILVLTNLDQTFHVRNMFVNGARGYLLKDADQHTLLDAIETVHKGNQYVDASLRSRMLYEMLDTKRANNVPTLTKREQEILELIAGELTSAQIAKHLSISLHTVENHRVNIFFKLGVTNAVGMIRKAVQLGLIKV